MQGLPQIHYRPRQGATYEPSLDVLVPALMRLRNCTDSLKTLVLLDSLPDLILPALALTASQKTYVPPIAVRTIVRYCGPAFLERTLGKPQARSASALYRARGHLRHLITPLSPALQSSAGAATNQRKDTNMHDTKAIEQHVRSVAERNGFSVKRHAGKRYTVSENDGVHCSLRLASTTSIIF